MHGSKQPYGVRIWRILERPCHGDSHEYSNKWYIYNIFIFGSTEFSNNNNHTIFFKFLDTYCIYSLIDNVYYIYKYFQIRTVKYSEDSIWF